jgi:hypothetical protein
LLISRHHVVSSTHRYRSHPAVRIRERFEQEIARMKIGCSAMLWAMERHVRQSDETVSRQVRALRQELATEFGAASKLAAGL